MAEGRIAALVTAYRIGPILSDTLITLMEQREVTLDLVVLVVDGCGLTGTTQAIARRFARRYPGFRTLWLENGGVARARNEGVRYLLDQLPDLEAVFLLDGDDLVPPRALASTLARLRRARGEPGGESIGWVYFDQTQFGAETRGLRYPDGSMPVRWLASNLSQPSCLYSAQMFRAGVLWDESMRQGIEDWEYWLAAAQAGFRGVHDPDITLKYRRLTGNRSSLNRAKDSLTKRYMRGKHRDLMTPRRLLAEEAATFPRWALRDGEGWRLTSDPGAAGVPAGRGDLVRALAARRSQYAPRAVLLDRYFPDMVAVLPEAARRRLEQSGLLQHALLQAEAALSEVPVVSLHLDGEGTGWSRERGTVRADSFPECDAVFLSTTRLHEILKPVPAASADRGEGKASLITRLRRRLKGSDRSTAEPVAAPPAFGQLAAMHLRLPCPGPAGEPVAVGAVLDDLAGAMREVDAVLGDREFLLDQNRFCGIDKAHHPGFWHEVLGLWPVLPREAVAGLRDIALVLPDAPGGEVRDFLERLASVASHRLTLVTLGDRLAESAALGLPEETERLSLGLPCDVTGPDRGLNYFGVPLFERRVPEVQRCAAGMLATMDVVVNFAGPVAAGPLMAVRKLGVATALGVVPEAGDASLMSPAPVAEDAARDIFGGLSHAAAYDRIFCPDPATACRLRAIGVPAAMIEPDPAGWIAGLGAEDETTALARAS